MYSIKGNEKSGALSIVVNPNYELVLQWKMRVSTLLSPLIVETLLHGARETANPSKNHVCFLANKGFDITCANHSVKQLHRRRFTKTRAKTFDDNDIVRKTPDCSQSVVQLGQLPIGL